MAAAASARTAKAGRVVGSNLSEPVDERAAPMVYVSLALFLIVVSP